MARVSYQTFMRNGKRVKRRTLTKAKKAERMRKFRATMAARHAAAEGSVAPPAKIRRSAHPRKAPAHTRGEQGRDAKANGHSRPLTVRVDESLTLMQEGLDWLVETYGRQVFSRMDRAHKKFLLAREALVGA